MLWGEVQVRKPRSEILVRLVAALAILALVVTCVFAARFLREWWEHMEPGRGRMVRVKLALASSDLRRIAEAAAMYHAREGKLPDSEQDLVEKGLLRGISTDPFTGFSEPYRFQTMGCALYVWSVGPDGVDDGAVPLYDPTNGLDSKGDIVRAVRSVGERQLRAEDAGESDPSTDDQAQ